eukprot:959006_1
MSTDPKGEILNNVELEIVNIPTVDNDEVKHPQEASQQEQPHNDQTPVNTEPRPQHTDPPLQEAPAEQPQRSQQPQELQQHDDCKHVTMNDESNNMSVHDNVPARNKIVRDYGDLLTQINTLNDAQQRQTCLDLFQENHEALIAWIGTNIQRLSRSLRDTLLQESEETDLTHLKGRIDAGKYLAKMLAILVLTNRRESSSEMTVFDESGLQTLQELEYELGHITCWIIRTKGSPSGTRSVKLNDGYKLPYAFAFTVDGFERNIREWCQLYCNNRGEHRDSNGKAKRENASQPNEVPAQYA